MPQESDNIIGTDIDLLARSLPGPARAPMARWFVSCAEVFQSESLNWQRERAMRFQRQAQRAAARSAAGMIASTLWQGGMSEDQAIHAIAQQTGFDPEQLRAWLPAARRELEGLEKMKRNRAIIMEYFSGNKLVKDIAADHGLHVKSVSRLITKEQERIAWATQANLDDAVREKQGQPRKFGRVA